MLSVALLNATTYVSVLKSSSRRRITHIPEQVAPVGRQRNVLYRGKRLF